MINLLEQFLATGNTKHFTSPTGYSRHAVGDCDTARQKYTDTYAFKGHAVRGHLGTYTLGQGHESSLVMEGQGRVMASRHAAWVMEGRADFS